MTTAAVLESLRRRFYVLLAGLAVTIAGAFVVLDRPGVYSTRCDVVLVPPQDLADTTDTTLVSPSENLIALAGLVERTVNRGRSTSSTSQEVDLLGTGVRDGALVSLPNAGGQWDYNFTAPMISVQVAGPDPRVVDRRRRIAVEQIQEAVLEIQKDGGVSGASRLVGTQMVPDLPPVVYRTGRNSRAAAGILAIGGWLSVLATVLVDRGLAARSRRRRDNRADEVGARVGNADHTDHTDDSRDSAGASVGDHERVAVGATRSSGR
jgi:hypothetical protein